MPVSPGLQSRRPGWIGSDKKGVVIVRLARTGVAVVVLLFLAGGVMLSGVASAHSKAVLPMGDYTSEQVTFAEDLVHRTEAALPDFITRDELKAQGFQEFGISTIEGYDHWTNFARIDDGHIIDPAFPESLVLKQTAEGYRIDAAMFFLPSKHDLTNIPADIAWLPGWHSHNDELCVDGQNRFASFQYNGTCSVGVPMASPPMMHVWTFDNDCGHRFAGLGSPGLKCLGDDHGSGHGSGHGGGMPMPGGTYPYPYPGGTYVPYPGGTYPLPYAYPVPPAPPTPAPDGAVSPSTAVRPATAVRANPNFTG